LATNKTAANIRFYASGARRMNNQHLYKAKQHLVATVSIGDFVKKVN
jgi:hypothetical protein